MVDQTQPESSKETHAGKTCVEMTQVVLPQFANAHGNVFGGQIVSWIDICAAVAAQRHCRNQVVTASIDAVHFIAPVRLGHIVILKGQVNAAFRTSMECGVSVWMEDPQSGEKARAAKAYATFVSLGPNGNPRPIPQFIPTTPEEKRRAADALTRRKNRLELRQTIKRSKR